MKHKHSCITNHVSGERLPWTTCDCGAAEHNAPPAPSAMRVEPCGIIHGDQFDAPDATGCVLPMGHDGPHEYADHDGRHWLWETDMECDCEHCMECLGDYCTIYWRKPGAVGGGKEKTSDQGV